MAKKYYYRDWRSRFCWDNLIKFLLKKTKYKIISLDNYTSGYKKNHVKDKVKYIKADTKDINKVISNSNKIKAVSFWRICRIHRAFADE